MKRNRAKPFRPQADHLETRLVLDGSVTLPPSAPAPSSNADLPTPVALRSYYGVGDLEFAGTGSTTVAADGRGQTVVVIGVNQDPTFRNSSDPDWQQSALAQFSKNRGLPYNAAGWNSDFSFQMVTKTGAPADPAAVYNAEAGTKKVDPEFNMDVEAVHSMAPRANIIAILLDTATDFDTAITQALTYKPASITISYGDAEKPGAGFHTYVDNVGTTYFTSAGDSGAGMQYSRVLTKSTPTGDGNYDDTYSNNLTYLPMNNSDPLQVLVGGSKVTVAADGTLSEAVWGNGSDSLLGRLGYWAGGAGGGGGYSLYEARPSFQAQSRAVAANQASFPLPSAGMRLGPDISMMANPAFQIMKYDAKTSQYVWTNEGGTSLASPLMAGLNAVVAQGRQAAGLPALSSSDFLNFIYQANSSDFHDITQGTNGYDALPGFDLASGLGTPTASLISSLVAATYDTTTLVSSTAQVGAGGPRVTMTARVAPTFGARVATGLVAFTDNGTVLATVPLDASGQATFVETGSFVGTRSIQARFLGSGFFAASEGTASPVAVVAPTATVLASLPVGGTPVGQAVSLAASVLPAFGSQIPTGAVRFYDGDQLLGAAELDATGRAGLAVQFSTVGQHSIRAVYDGAATFAASTSTDESLRASAATTTTTLIAQPGVRAGDQQPVSLVVGVAAAPGVATPSGLVTFYADGQVVGTASLDSTGRAGLVVAESTAGVRTFRAEFAGSDSFAASSGTAAAVPIIPGATTTTLANWSGVAITLGQPITLSATVQGPAGPASPGGVVTFLAAGRIIGTGATDAAGRATLTFTPADPGTLTVAARFDGQGLLDPSASDAGSIAVAAASTRTTIDLLTPSVVLGNVPVILRASVGSPLAAGGGGVVQFWDNGQVVGSVPVDADGRATLAYTPNGAGVHYLLAAFGGSDRMAASLSPLGAVAVLAGSTTTTMQVRPIGNNGNDALLSLTATVSTAQATPAGVVAFRVGSRVLAWGVLDSNGRATAFGRVRRPGNPQVTAEYLGSAGLAPSQSPGTSIRINSAPRRIAPRSAALPAGPRAGGRAGIGRAGAAAVGAAGGGHNNRRG